MLTGDPDTEFRTKYDRLSGSYPIRTAPPIRKPEASMPEKFRTIMLKWSAGNFALSVSALIFVALPGFIVLQYVLLALSWIMIFMTAAASKITKWACRDTVEQSDADQLFKDWLDRPLTPPEKYHYNSVKLDTWAAEPVTNFPAPKAASGARATFLCSEDAQEAVEALETALWANLQGEVRDTMPKRSSAISKTPYGGCETCGTEVYTNREAGRRRCDYCEKARRSVGRCACCAIPLGIRTFDDGLCVTCRTEKVKASYTRPDHDLLMKLTKVNAL